MIPVAEQPEPPGFDERVRIPGQKFLSEAQNFSPLKWDGKEYWRKVIPDLREAYGGVCAYCAFWMAPTENASVDHFIPRSVNAALAYEWSNFRLASPKINSAKGTKDVLDPFQIEYEWFVLDFSSLMVKPNNGLESYIFNKIQDTINRLKLNKQDPWIDYRFLLVSKYIQRRINFEELKELAPFIAYELERQNLKDDIASILRV